MLFATQRSSGGPGPFVLATHRNPLGITETNKAVYDPLGNFIPFQAHGDPRPPAGSFSSASMPGLSASQADPDGYGMGCLRDDLPASCYSVFRALNRQGAKKLIISGGTQDPLATLASHGITFVTGRTQVSSGDPNDPLDEFHAIPRDVDALEHVNFAPGSQGGLTRNPQNPVPLSPDQLSAISSQIGALLNDKCAKFINHIVGGRTGKPYDSKKDLLTAFNSIRDGKGGFFFGGTSYGGDQRGSLAAGSAEIRIGNSAHFTDPTRAFSAAFTALHEIIHAVAGNDVQLSRQVQELGIPVLAFGYPNRVMPYPTDTDNKNLAFSSYWGQALKNACDPNGVPK